MRVAGEERGRRRPARGRRASGSSQTRPRPRGRARSTAPRAHTCALPARSRRRRDRRRAAARSTTHAARDEAEAEHASEPLRRQRRRPPRASAGRARCPEESDPGFQEHVIEGRSGFFAQLGDQVPATRAEPGERNTPRRATGLAGPEAAKREARDEDRGGSEQGLRAAACLHVRRRARNLQHTPAGAAPGAQLRMVIPPPVSSRSRNRIRRRERLGDAGARVRSEIPGEEDRPFQP